jgi:hypothetical protein
LHLSIHNCKQRLNLNCKNLLLVLYLLNLGIELIQINNSDSKSGNLVHVAISLAAGVNTFYGIYSNKYLSEVLTVNTNIKRF